MAGEPSFRGLPSETRLHIYSYLTHDSHVLFTTHNISKSAHRPRVIWSSPGRHLLAVSRTTRKEVMPLLAANTTIQINAGSLEEVIARTPADFPSLAKSLNVQLEKNELGYRWFRRPAANKDAWLFLEGKTREITGLKRLNLWLMAPIYMRAGGSIEEWRDRSAWMGGGMRDAVRGLKRVLRQRGAHDLLGVLINKENFLSQAQDAALRPRRGRQPPQQLPALKIEIMKCIRFRTETDDVYHPTKLVSLTCLTQHSA